MKRLLFNFINILVFLLVSSGIGVSSDIKNEPVRFSSETAHIKKRDGILHLSGEVTISYAQYLIKADHLTARTNNVESPEVTIIEANKNIYFSNNNDISAKGDKLFMDVNKKFVSIEGNVEFTQGKSVIRAKKINVDLVTETVDFEGIKESIIKN